MNGLKYIALTLTLLMMGCSGYSFGEEGTSVLPPGDRTVAVEKITNPSTLSWMEPRLRSLLRDELNNRNTITWVDSPSKADATITINVLSYNRPTAVSGAKEETLRSVASISLKATVRSTITNEIIWTSGTLSQDWPFFTGGETEADMEVTQQIIRQLANHMTQNY